MTEVKGTAVAINLDLVVTDPEPRFHAPGFCALAQVGYLARLCGGCEAPLATTALPRVPTPVWEPLARVACHVDPTQGQGVISG